MSINEIHIFVLTAKYRNITRAAKEIGISQSTASRRLQRLEQELGRKLFQKNGSAIELTQPGQTFLNEVAPSVSRLYAVTQRYSRREEALTLAGSHGPCSHLLPSLIEAFSPRYPAARIKLRLGSSPEIEKWLSIFEVDLAVVSNRIMSSSLQTEPFRNEKLIAFVVPSHPLARKRSIPMSEFGDIRLIVKIRREGQSRTEAQLNEFAKKGIKFKTVIRCESSQSLKQTVRHGQGVGILFQDTIKPEIDQEEFVAVQFARLNVVRQTHIAYSKERPLSPSARGFLSLLRASATNSTIIKPMTRQISNGQQTVAPGRLGVEAFMTSKSGAKSSPSKIGLGPR